MYATAWSTVVLVRSLASKMSIVIPLTAVDGIGLLVWDLDAEFLLNRHDHLHGIQTVEPKVIVEMGGAGNLSSIVRRGPRQKAQVYQYL